MLLLDHCVISFDLLLRKPVREKKKIISRNIRAIDMRDFRTDVHNLLESATQSNSSDLLGVYNTCFLQLFDRHAPLVTRTVKDCASAPWMTLEIKQAKAQRRLAERKWRESGLTVHREIYVKQRNLVSNMISKAKKDYLCHIMVNCSSSQEFFRLSVQMMGKFGDTMLPSNISHESLPDKFNEFFVHKIERDQKQLWSWQTSWILWHSLCRVSTCNWILCKNHPTPENALKALWPRPHIHPCPLWLFGWNYSHCDQYYK